MIEQLAEYCARENVPGVSVATFTSAGPTAVGSHGVIDVESRTPMRPASMFRIYSLAKLLTACAVVRLARDGRVDLDAGMDEYVDGLSRRSGAHPGTVTVRQALSHSGGLVPDALTWARLGRNDGDLAIEVTHDYARAFSFATPGRHYGYCNASFNLAAVLIERVTGRTFAEAMRSLVLDPIEMRETTYDPAVAMTYSLAQQHVVVDGVARVVHRPLVGSKWMAGSQCYSTLTDMTRFGSWLLRELRDDVDGPRVDRPVADLRLDVGTRYGLGCYLTPTYAGGMVVGHEGFFDGMWVKLIVDPRQDRGLMWMDNRGDEVRDARYAVMRQMAPGLLPHGDHAGAAADAGRGVPAAGLAALYHRVGAPDLCIENDGDGLVLTIAGRRRSVQAFGPDLWCSPATAEDRGVWRPHAGSTMVCLGAATLDADGTQVVHLNAIPYIATRTATERSRQTTAGDGNTQ